MTFLLVVLVALGAWTLYELLHVGANLVIISQAQAIIAAKIDRVSERLDRMESAQSVDDVDMDDVDEDEYDD